MNKKSMLHLGRQGDENNAARESQMQGKSFVLSEILPFSAPPWVTENGERKRTCALGRKNKGEAEVDTIIENGYEYRSKLSRHVPKAILIAVRIRVCVKSGKTTSKRTLPKALVISDENPLRLRASCTNDRNIMNINMLVSSLRWKYGKRKRFTLVFHASVENYWLELDEAHDNVSRKWEISMVISE